MAGKRKRRAVGARKRAPKKNAPKMRKAPKGWMAAKAVRVVKRGGKTVVEVKR